jgi:hypothetical protein
VSPGQEHGEPDDKKEPAEGASELSALEDALRQALASLPRDQVVRCVLSALPSPAIAEVLVDQDTRLHGGKVRKVSVSMPEELTDAVRARTGAGGFSRYVADAVQEQIRHDMLGDLIAEFEATPGPVPEDLIEKAMREWPDDGNE